MFLTGLLMTLIEELKKPLSINNYLIPSEPSKNNAFSDIYRPESPWS